MSLIENTLISVADYNAIRNAAILIMGTGTGSRGYGQTIFSIAKSENQLVSQTDWDNLRFDLLNARIHQNGSGVLTEINENQTIGVNAISLFSSLNTTIDNNRFQVALGRFLTQGANVDESDLIVSRTYSGGQEWKDEISCTLTVTFTDANRARFFFNSGGTIRIKSTRAPITNGRTDTQNTSWTTLLNTVAMREFGGQIPGNSRNFYNLTNSFQEFYSRASDTYSLNKYILEARCNVPDNSSGTANIVFIRIRFVDGYVDPDTLAGRPANLNPPAEGVEGTFTVEVSEKRAQSIGGILPSGNFIIQRPAYSITAITGT